MNLEQKFRTEFDTAKQNFDAICSDVHLMNLTHLTEMSLREIQATDNELACCARSYYSCDV